MKKQVLIVTLAIAGLLSSAGNISAYCVYYNANSPEKKPLDVFVFPSEAAFKRAMQVEKWGGKAIEMGAKAAQQKATAGAGAGATTGAATGAATQAADTATTAATSSATGGASGAAVSAGIGAAKNFITDYDVLGKITRGTDAAKHQLDPSKDLAPGDYLDFACWNYQEMGLDPETFRYFGVVDPSNAKFLGGNILPAGGYVKLQINANGELGYAVYHPDGRLVNLPRVGNPQVPNPLNWR